MTGFVMLDRAGLWRRSLGHENWALETFDPIREATHESACGWLPVRMFDPRREGVTRILADHGIEPTAVALAVLANAPLPSGSAAP